MRRHGVAQAVELGSVGRDEAEDGGDEMVVWDGGWGTGGRGWGEGVGGNAEGGEKGGLLSSVVLEGDGGLAGGGWMGMDGDGWG